MKVIKKFKLDDTTKFEKYSYIYTISIVTLIFIYNLIRFSIFEGYDADAHIAYVDFISMYLPRDFVLPLEEHTYEYFSPPIAYLFPSLVQIICRNFIESADIVKSCQPIYGKLTQVFQTILLGASIYIYSKILKKLLNKNSVYNLTFLILVSTMAVNYRSFLMIRGEPYIIFFLSLLILNIIKNKDNLWKIKAKEIISFSLIVSGIMLSRQWGALLLPALLFLTLIVKKDARLNYFKFMSYVLILFLIISMPFFLHLLNNSGSLISFNKDPSGFSFDNQPSNFYNPLNQSAFKLFTNPIRGNFDNQYFPILYSDLWGDYWGYFSFVSNPNLDSWGQNSIGGYLGRVNLFSIIPFLIFVISFFKVKSNNLNREVVFYTKYSIIFSLIGYTWFLIMYPELPSGDTIKATYMLQIFFLLAFLSAIYTDQIKHRNIKLYILLNVILLLVFSHNVMAFIVHF